MSTPTDPRASRLRSRTGFGKRDRWGLGHRAWLRAEGFSEKYLTASRSDLQFLERTEQLQCPLRTVAEAVSEASGRQADSPLEFPTISARRNADEADQMLFRNLMAMDVEECIRAHPLDAVCCCAAATVQRRHS